MARRARASIAVLGGGVWVASLVEVMIRRIACEEVDIRLAARDMAKLGTIADYCRRRSQARGGWTVAALPVEKAIDGADIIVLMQRIGGAEARLRDETFPRALGLAGDEGLGAGGFANALRTLPVLTALSRDLRRLCPRASVLNLVAPLGLTTRLLIDEGISAIGVCELPITTQSRLRASLAPEDREGPLNYTGINHIGWFYAPPGRADMFARAIASNLVDREVFERFGAAPLFYYYRLYDPSAAERLGLQASPGRAHQLQQLSASALAQMAHGAAEIDALEARPTPWFGKALVPLLGALLDGDVWHGFANVSADADACWYEKGSLVETRVRLENGTLVQVHPPQPAPAPVRTFLKSALKAEEGVYRVARNTPDIDAIRKVLQISSYARDANLTEVARSILMAV